MYEMERDTSTLIQRTYILENSGIIETEISKQATLACSLHAGCTVLFVYRNLQDIVGTKRYFESNPPPV